MKWKSRPAAHLALHPDAAAHQFHQPGYDGQAQARAAVTPGQRAVDLLEHLEDRRLFLFGDADARVADGEVQQHLVVGLRLPLPRRAPLRLSR